MAAPALSSLHVSTMKRTLITWLLPRIALFTPGDWTAVLEQARTVDFDFSEWLGLLLGTALTAYFLRFDSGFATSWSLSFRYFIQFFSALPILALLVGPFYLRRLRRGLEREIERRNTDS